MSARALVGGVLFVTALTTGTVATHGEHIQSAQQWAVAYLTEPTLVGSTIVQGPVLITHDEHKMARGEPCTTIRLFDPRVGPLEEIVSFVCIPRSSTIVSKFTVRTIPNAKLGYGCVLTEYQFAGDSEAHGVPIPIDTH